MKKRIQILTALCLYSIATPLIMGMEEVVVIDNYSNDYNPMVADNLHDWDPDTSPPELTEELIQTRKNVETWASNGAITEEMARVAGEFLADFVKSREEGLAQLLHRILRHEDCTLEYCVQIANRILSESKQRQYEDVSPHLTLAREISKNLHFVRERNYGNSVPEIAQAFKDWFGIKQGWSDEACEKLAAHIIEGEDLTE